MAFPVSNDRLVLPDVTLCAATSVNVVATVSALERSLKHADFAECILFTDTPIDIPNPKIRVVSISRMTSSADYSSFLLNNMVQHIDTSHCLVVQWDGHVVNPDRWRPEFMDYDYIGARWPQFSDGHDVGNGGFSLRSTRLMRAVRSISFPAGHPEDIVIARDHRTALEECGMRFAPSALADAFSAERAGDWTRSFGYHGTWLMPRILGVAAFWKVYRTLDARGPVWHDLSDILKQVWEGRGGALRALRLIVDRIRD